MSILRLFEILPRLGWNLSVIAVTHRSKLTTAKGLGKGLYCTVYSRDQDRKCTIHTVRVVHVRVALICIVLFCFGLYVQYISSILGIHTYLHTYSTVSWVTYIESCSRNYISAQRAEGEGGRRKKEDMAKTVDRDVYSFRIHKKYN